VFTKIVKDVIAEDSMESFEAFAGRSFPVLEERWGRRSCGGFRNGGHVDNPNEKG